MQTPESEFEKGESVDLQTEVQELKEKLKSLNKQSKENRQGSKKSMSNKSNYDYSSSELEPEHEQMKMAKIIVNIQTLNL